MLDWFSLFKMSRRERWGGVQFCLLLETKSINRPIVPTEFLFSQLAESGHTAEAHSIELMIAVTVTGAPTPPCTLYNGCTCCMQTV